MIGITMPQLVKRESLYMSSTPIAALQATPRRHKTPRGRSQSPSPIRGSGTPGSRSTPEQDFQWKTPTRTPQDAAAHVLSPRQCKPWPKLKTRVKREKIIAATKALYGYPPREWQLQVMEQILEGHDVMTVAGTGSGKSLVFALVAIAAALAKVDGLVIVISPLKALQNDQVRPRSLIYLFDC